MGGPFSTISRSQPRIPPNDAEGKRVILALCIMLGRDYVLLESANMMATHLVLFVKQSLADLISDVESDTVATGLAGCIGNKGGVAVGFSIGQTSLLFVNAHFAAHQNQVQNDEIVKFRSKTSVVRIPDSITKPKPEPIVAHKQVEDRNSDFSRINSELRMGRGGNRTEGQLKAVNVVDRYDCVFWGGDLNYRINGNRGLVDLSMKKEFREVEIPFLILLLRINMLGRLYTEPLTVPTPVLQVLVHNDQLLLERAKGNVFEGFLEGPLDFRPTYELRTVPHAHSQFVRSRLLIRIDHCVRWDHRYPDVPAPLRFVGIP